MGRAGYVLCGFVLLLCVLISPAQARFLQVDPIGYDDQVNLYAYVGNDPVNQTDPTGKCAECREDEIAFGKSLQGKTPDQMEAAIYQRAQDRLPVLLAVTPFPQVTVATRFTGAALKMMRTAEFSKPVANGIAAATQRTAAVVANLKGLAAGEGRVIAGTGAKEGFRGSERAAAQYGGKPGDYSKVSVSRVTDAGDRVSVHAVRNDATGKIYQQKVIYGR